MRNFAVLKSQALSAERKWREKTKLSEKISDESDRYYNLVQKAIRLRAEDLAKSQDHTITSVEREFDRDGVVYKVRQTAFCSCATKGIPGESDPGYLTTYAKSAPWLLFEAYDRHLRRIARKELGVAVRI